MQEIEDHYKVRGFSGEALRHALEADADFQRLFAERKAVIRNRLDITADDEKQYLLPTEQDYEILSKIKALESRALSASDRKLVALMRSQLEHDWRATLLARLNDLLRSYPESEQPS